MAETVNKFVVLHKSKGRWFFQADLLYGEVKDSKMYDSKQDAMKAYKHGCIQWGHRRKRQRHDRQ